MKPSVIGLDAGTAKSGLCILARESDGDWSVARLELLDVGARSVADPLAAGLEASDLSRDRLVRVAVDAPVGAQKVENNRPIESLFRRGAFHQSALVPNSPKLLDIPMDELLDDLEENFGVEWSNDWTSPDQPPRVVRETYPNAVLGLLFSPETVEQHRDGLRFRFSRGGHVSPVGALFDLVANSDGDEIPEPVEAFFAPLGGGDAIDWQWLDDRITTASDERPSEGNDLVAALVCALAGLHDWQRAREAHTATGNAGYVRTTGSTGDGEPAGHFLLPPMIDDEWLGVIEHNIASLTKPAGDAALESELRSPRRTLRATSGEVVTDQRN